MILEPGDKVMVVHRRLFETDRGRFFLGTVEEYEAGIARVRGFTFVREPFEGGISRKEDERTKIISVSSGTLIVYRLASHFEVEAAQIIATGGKLVLRDHGGHEMNLTESGNQRQPRRHASPPRYNG